ncbi:MAG: phage protein Gp36 family protein [Bacteroidota bacterium]
MRYFLAALLCALALLAAPVHATAPSSAAIPAALALTERSADMAYCAPADVTGKYETRTLAQRTGDASGQAVDAAKLQEAIDDFAAKHIDPAVRACYGDHAFGLTEPTLNAINAEGAYLELARRRPGGMDDGERRDLDRLLRQLTQIATCKLELSTGAVQQPETPVPADVWTSRERYFGRRT